jgi:polysaccharide pyruvyl transferase WcaK-like protein
MIRALYVGYTKDTENHGDEALMWIIRDLLAPEIHVRPDWKEYDLALLGGGTLINQSPWLIDYFASALDRSGGHGLVFGTGVGDLAFWGNHFDRWIPLLERCSLIGVRGPESVALLRQHGFERAQVCGDPYLSLLAPVVRVNPIPKLLGVNFGSTNNAVWGLTDSKLENLIGGALEVLARRGWSFAFFSVWSRDLPILSSMAQTFPNVGFGSPCYDTRTDTLQAYSALAACDLFLGEKLHACAMAAVARVPFIALEYQPKVRDFAASIDMERWTFSTADLDPEKLAALVEELHKLRHDVRNRLDRGCFHLRRKIMNFADEVKRTVAAGSRSGPR